MPQLPRGLYDVDFTLIDDAGALVGSPIGNIYPRRLAQTYQADTFDIEAADQRLEQGEHNERMNLELEVAGFPLALIAALEGSTVETSGSGDTLKSLIRKNVVTHQRPFGRLRSQQHDKGAGHTTFIFPKVAAASSMSTTANQGEYATPTMSLVAYPVTDADATTSSVVGDFFYLVQGATAVALADLDDDIDTIAA